MQLRGLTVRNRVWLPPMDMYSAYAPGRQTDAVPLPALRVSRSRWLRPDHCRGHRRMPRRTHQPQGRGACGRIRRSRPGVGSCRASGMRARPWPCSSTTPGARGPRAASASAMTVQACRLRRADGRPWRPAPTPMASYAAPRELSVDEIHAIVGQFAAAE